MEASFKEDGDSVVRKLERRAWFESWLPRREVADTRRGVGAFRSAAIWRATVIASCNLETAFGL